jgi:hypothetical protein
LDFVRTAQTAVSLRGDTAANDDWWLQDRYNRNDWNDPEYKRKLMRQIEQVVRDNPELFPPDFLIDPL